LALLAALLVAGCGSGGSSGTTSGTETSPAGTSTAPETPTGVRSRACRTGGEETLLLRVTNVGCAQGASVAARWRSSPDCSPAAGQSRSACSIGGFRCLTSVAGRGLAVTCARPEHSIAFIVERG
jgi:hypothetical protein